MLACRNCRISLDAQTGCAICDPVRKHLVVVGEDEIERPSLSGTGHEVVAALRGQLKEVRERLRIDPTDVRAEGRLLAIGNTAAKVLESVRKLQADGVSAVENMSFSERAELFVSWIQELAPAYRAALRDKWDAWERELSKPRAPDQLPLPSGSTEPS